MFINILHVYMRFYIIYAFIINTDRTRTSVMKRLRPIGNGVLVNTNNHSLICLRVYAISVSRTYNTHNKIVSIFHRNIRYPISIISLFC